MPQSQYFAGSGIENWRNRLNRCLNLNISQNPASKIEEIFCIDADDHLNKILQKIIINGIEKSGQVRFKLPESLNLWGPCYALHARCSLLQQTYPSLLPVLVLHFFLVGIHMNILWNQLRIPVLWLSTGVPQLCWARSYKAKKVLKPLSLSTSCLS